MRRAIPALALLVAAAAPGLAQAPPTSPDPAESVRAAEIAFAAAASARDREAFASLIADDAIFIDVAAHNGRTAILEAWEVFFQPDGPLIDWSPELVAIQDGGQVGVSRGPYSVTREGQDGEPVELSGLFTSIWRREADGAWKLIFDLGCPACGEPLTTGPAPDAVDLELRVVAGTMNHRFLSYETCTTDGCSQASYLQWFKTEWDPDSGDESELPERIVLETCPLPELSGETEILSARWRAGSGADPELSVLVSPPARDPDEYELRISPGRPCEYTAERTGVSGSS